MKIRIFKKILSVRTAKDYIDGKLLRYAWYRRFAAKRRRAEKEKVVGDELTTDDIEVYTPTVPQSEVDRTMRVRARRELQELEFQAEANERNAEKS